MKKLVVLSFLVLVAAQGIAQAQTKADDSLQYVCGSKSDKYAGALADLYFDVHYSSFFLQGYANTTADGNSHVNLLAQAPLDNSASPGNSQIVVTPLQDATGKTILATTLQSITVTVVDKKVTSIKATKIDASGKTVDVVYDVSCQVDDGSK